MLIIFLMQQKMKKLKLKMKKGRYESGEIGLPMFDSQLILPCGIFAKWEKK